MWLWIARRKTLKTFDPITSKNSASVFCTAAGGVNKIVVHRNQFIYLLVLKVLSSEMDPAEIRLIG
jgi:hypothetical protein